MNNDKVVKVDFRKSKRGSPSLVVLNNVSTKLKSCLPRKETLKRAILWGWCLLRLPVYLVMYWLRLPIIFVCNMISVPMLLAWYAFPDKTAMVWGFATISFLAFVVSWSYDFILMAISPQEMFRNL